MAIDARTALQQLRDALDDGRLDQDLERLGVQLLGAFGSATRPGGTPSDLDVAAAFSGPAHLLELVDLLVAATGFDHVDVAVVDGQHPVLDAEALCGIPLYEATPGAFAVAQMAALGHRRDTARFRDLDLARLAR